MARRRARSLNPRTSRRRKGVKLLVSLVVLALLATAAAALVWNELYRVQHDVAPGATVEITIPKGSSTAAIAEKLTSAGIVDNQLMFRLKARDSGVDGQLRAGTYQMKTGIGYSSAFALLKKGPNIVYFDVPIPEGFNSRKIAARFAARTGVDEDEFFELITTGAPRYAEKHPYLEGAYGDSLEGFLFPATYRIKKGTSAEKIVEMMLEAFDAHTADLDLTYAESKNLTLTDVVIIASILEREVRLAEEYPLVSSVIYNRLKINMRLQLDSTVFHTLPEGTKILTKKDLESTNPYNTYTQYGLPPGPLGNPGFKALDAAANPAETKYLYYVLTGEDGSQTFATNYDDFLKAVKIYREKFVNKK